MRMVKPKVKVIRFSGDDVIATSGGYLIPPEFLTLSNFDDEDTTNNTFSYIYSSTGDTRSFTASDGGVNDLVTYLQEFVNLSNKANPDPGTVSEETYFRASVGGTNYFIVARNLLQASKRNQYNGNYKWDTAYRRFQSTN